MSKRKKVMTGDSPSLWNCTLSPGWNREEVQILRLAIMKFGLGRWSKILASKCLPEKTRRQLNLQTQRMLGQQSIGEFLGIHLDTDIVFQENNKKTEVVRKNGYIINTGNNQTKEEKDRKIKENREKYEIQAAQIAAITLPAPKTKSDSRAHKLQQLELLQERLEFLERKLAEREEANDIGQPNGNHTTATTKASQNGVQNGFNDAAANGTTKLKGALRTFEQSEYFDDSAEEDVEPTTKRRKKMVSAWG